MIDRKLLKTNRWFDEEFLHARMTNACFNGGGGGDGGADDDEAYEGEAMQDYEADYGGGDREETRTISQIVAEQQAIAAAQAQENARIAHAQSVAEERAQAVANRNAAAAAARNVDTFSGMQDAVASQNVDTFGGMQDVVAGQNVDTFGGMQDAVAGQNVDTFGGMQDAIARQNVDTFAGGFLDPTRSPSQDFQTPTQRIDILGSQPGLDAATKAAIDANAGTDFFGGGNVSGGYNFGDDATDPWDRNNPNRAEEGGGDDRVFITQPDGTVRLVTVDDPRNTRITDTTTTNLPPSFTIETSCFVDGVQVELADGTEKNVAEISVGDVVKTQEGDGSVVKVFHSKAGKQKLYGFNDKEPFVTEAHPFMTQDGWKKVSELEVGDTLYRNGLGLDTVDSIESKEIPEDTPVYNFHVDKQENYYADGYLVHNKISAPPPGGGTWPPGGDNIPPWPPGGGGGGAWPPGGGGGYPPTYGAGGRTGGGMPGYMANYPIHSQNLFNFTPARAMPGIDPSYQPWMQPAQGMSQNLWNYQAPNLLPWDMTNRVPWNFANTPTGQYGPMVATVGGEPAERGQGA